MIAFHVISSKWFSGLCTKFSGVSRRGENDKESTGIPYGLRCKHGGCRVTWGED